MYGSPLWQLNSEEHAKLNRSWNTAVKIIWDLPHPTNTHLLESLCPVPHLESVLVSRYIGFIDNLEKSSKGVLKILFRTCALNLSTVTGQVQETKNRSIDPGQVQDQELQSLLLIRAGILEDYFD